MSEPRPITRRTALTGISAGGLGLAFASQLAAVSARAQAGSLADHPLTGLWLTMVALSSNPDVTVAVPSIYGADGSLVLLYPCSELGQGGVQLKGAAIGTWEAMDDHTGHFTTVQVLSNMEGTYLGTLTLDGHPKVSTDGQSFEDNDPTNLATIRDAANAIVTEILGQSSSPAIGYRMTPGNPGFSAHMGLVQPPRGPDLRKPD